MIATSCVLFPIPSFLHNVPSLTRRCLSTNMFGCLSVAKFYEWSELRTDTLLTVKFSRRVLTSHKLQTLNVEPPVNHKFRQCVTCGHTQVKNYLSPRIRKDVHATLDKAIQFSWFSNPAVVVFGPSASVSSPQLLFFLRRDNTCSRLVRVFFSCGNRHVHFFQTR